jgi:hypothetical protein
LSNKFRVCGLRARSRESDSAGAAEATGEGGFNRRLEYAPPVRKFGAMPEQRSSKAPWFARTFVLLVPFAFACALKFAMQTGWDSRVAAALPSGWVNWYRAVFGLITLTAAAFASWSYHGYRELGYKRFALVILTVLSTLVLSALSLALMAALLSANR